MKRLAVLCALALGLTADLRADEPCFGCGHQPWINMILARDKCRGRDQARLQNFWHDYYRTMSAYYGMIEHMDWVSYYKHHGTPIGCVQAGWGGPSTVQMAPIYVPPPTLYWGMTQNLVPPWSPPNVPWGCTPSCAPDAPCATCP